MQGRLAFGGSDEDDDRGDGRRTVPARAAAAGVALRLAQVFRRGLAGGAAMSGLDEVAGHTIILRSSIVSVSRILAWAAAEQP